MLGSENEIGTYLGSRVTRTSTSSFESLPHLVHVTKTEVNNFKRAVKIEKQIFRFQISMANSQLMNVVNASDKFLEVFWSLFFL